MKLCRFLRWKGSHDATTFDALMAAFSKNEVPYTCLKTGQPFGPDDELVSPECCGDDRSCFLEKKIVFPVVT